MTAAFTVQSLLGTLVPRAPLATLPELLPERTGRVSGPTAPGLSRP